MSSGSTPAAWVNFQLSGVPAEKRKGIFEYCGVDPDKQEFKSSELCSLVLRAVMVTDDTNYGHCKTSVPAGLAEFQFRIIQTAETLGDAIELTKRFTEKFQPNKKIGTRDSGDKCIFSIDLDGLDDDHAGAAEITWLITYLYGFIAFLGKPISVDKLYTRSKLYCDIKKLNKYKIVTNLTDNTVIEDNVEYSSISGIEFDKKYLSMPRSGTPSGDLLNESIKWQLLFSKINPIIGDSETPIISAEKILNSVEKLAVQRNVDLRQKRRIAYNESSYNLRDLQNAKKISNAAIMLCTTPLKIHEISLKLGFSDVRSFHRFFYDYSAFTPGDYRKQFGERFGLKDGDMVEMAMKIASEFSA